MTALDPALFDGAHDEGFWGDPKPRFSFEPKREITAYELALILRGLINLHHLDQKIFDGLPAEIARHFKRRP